MCAYMFLCAIVSVVAKLVYYLGVHVSVCLGEGRENREDGG